MDDFERFLNDGIARFVRQKATQLAGRYGFRQDEVDDIQQDLTLDCLQRLLRFDARRGHPEHFVRYIVKRGVASLIESQRAKRRGFGVQLCSLSAHADHDSPDLADSISEDGTVARQGRRASTFEQRLLLRLDLVKTIAALPVDLRRICWLLMAVDGIGQVATVVGISRATLHRRMRAIRAAFAQARLDPRLNGHSEPEFRSEGQPSGSPA